MIIARTIGNAGHIRTAGHIGIIKINFPSGNFRTARNIRTSGPIVPYWHNDYRQHH